MKDKTKPSKIKLCIVITIIVLTIVLIAALTMIFAHPPRFSFDKAYYGSPAAVLDKNVDDIQNLIDEKLSFGLLVYQPDCVTSTQLEKIVDQFVHEKHITVLKIAFSDLKKLSIGNQIRFYPTFILIDDGKIIDFLKADSDDDVPAYTTQDGFIKWFSSYVVLQYKGE